jgi:gluconokinase
MTLRVVIMGVSGCGKSVVGAGLAQRLELPYREGDDLHPAENVEKMRAGIALTDDDRWPWLDRVAQVLRTEAPVIVGCSALRRAYRDRIRAGAGDRVQLVHLAGAREVIAARLAARKHHFMPATLLDSQFATLEPPGPDEALTVDVDQPLPLILDLIHAHLKGVTQ